MKRRSPGASLLLLALLSLSTVAEAQHDHIDIYSSQPGGGDVVLDWDFDKQIHVFESVCAGGLCLYSTINPAFLAPTEDAPEGSLFAIEDGTQVSVELVAADAGVSLRIDGVRAKPGEPVILGTSPGIHNHPSWQLVVPEGQVGEYAISYKVKAEGYGDSAIGVSTVSNQPQAVPTPCSDIPCAGDCDGDGFHTADEMRVLIQIALDGSIDGCRRGDVNGDGLVLVHEIVGAAAADLAGCPEPPPATLASIQTEIFNPTCALLRCHDAASATGSLVLTEGTSYGELVGVEPEVAAARDAGLLRVAASDPDMSFLYRKLVGPRPEWGSRMPLTDVCLPPEQIDQIRRWIEEGAPDGG